jgi:hypothetical protein
MESRSHLNKAEEYKNNQVKECPYCNFILPLSDYNDHMFCHQIDQEENGQQSFNNINNFGIPMSTNNNSNNNSCNNNIKQNCNNNPSSESIPSNNNISDINNLNNINNNSSNFINQNSGNINDDNNFSLFNDNNENNINNIQPNINPQFQNLNRINIINDNNNNNNNINNINVNTQSNNNKNNINANNQKNGINNNNNNNNDQNKGDSSEQNQKSFLDIIKNYANYAYSWLPSKMNNNNDKDNEKIMNAPIESLSPEERERRYKLEEQRAYEKKILGIANSESKVKVEDNISYGEKITNYVQNNANTIFAVIDIIGCLTLHTPSIGRTITRVANFIGEQMNSSDSNNHNNNNNNIPNDIGELNDYNSIIRNHPELKDKDKDPDLIIKFLPISEVREIRNNNPNENNNNNNNKCIICLSEFEIGDQVSALPCAHVFHTECIASWLKKHCQCPVCKFDITLRSLIG